ncbi:MAG: GNAT family N-acetyltransferase [Lachnospiraceae bacterium]|nr:GNAT family N-acetyltransferase [Lachnospiraceae bacterium]
MKKLRFAAYEDKNSFRRVWDKCFNDSDVFSTWLFDNRFFPEMSVCLEEDNKIVSCIQSIPLNLYIRGKSIPSALVMGVSTDPEYGGRGYMKELYSFYLNNISEKGVILCPNTPVKIDTYYFSGAYPVSDISFAEGETDDSVKSTGVELINKDEYMDELYDLYCGFYKNYSGIVSRSLANFKLKAEDYTVDGGLVAVHKKDDRIDGYTFFYNMDELIYAEETVWSNENAKDEIIKFISSFTNGKKYKIKLPADMGGIPRSVMNIASVNKLLKALSLDCDGVIEISDPVNKENSGSFSLKDGRTYEPAHVSMDIGAFTQLIAGYRSLYELLFEGRAVIHNKEKADAIDKALPKLKTFIFDEY